MEDLLVPAAVGLFSLWLLLDWARPATPASGREKSNGTERLNQGLISLMVVVGWLFGLLPNLIDVLTRGRDTVIVTNVQSPTPLASQALQTLFAIFALIASAILILNIHRINFTRSPLTSKREPSTPTLKPTLIAIAPFAIALTSLVLNGGKISPDTVMYPLAAIAISVATVKSSTFRVLGIITIVTATGSIILAWVAPDAGTTPAPVVGDKEVWPTLLAGPYSHPNVLGLALSLGMPFILLLRHRLIRALGLFISAAALIWTGNRNSMFAASIAITVALLIKVRPKFRKLALVLGAIGGVAVIVLPLITTDPEAFSVRGQIWMASLHDWASHPLLGMGPNYYENAAQYFNNLGLTAFSGHNGAVHALATGGVLLLTATSWLVWSATASASLQPSESQPAAIAFCLVFIWGSVLQNSATFINLTELAFVSWVPLIALYIAPRREPDRLVGANDNATRINSRSDRWQNRTSK